ncbi:MAG: BlaI/MecI/CopY family transcriptional regulator [Xanthomonadales bacterium]|nr:BlaI/MecI/CopY family transcriptional regulator [Xanthomonadales bacterium]
MSQNFALSDLQLAVMRVLWSAGQSTTSEVAAALGQQRGLAHTTVATLLSRLEKRGLVQSQREGRQLSYRALIAESAVRRSMVSGLLGSLFAGDAGALVAHLLAEDEIAADDLRRVQALIDETEDPDPRGEKS